MLEDANMLIVDATPTSTRYRTAHNVPIQRTQLPTLRVSSASLQAIFPQYAQTTRKEST